MFFQRFIPIAQTRGQRLLDMTTNRIIKTPSTHTIPLAAGVPAGQQLPGTTPTVLLNEIT